MNVMIVDDSKVARSIVSNCFEKLGHEVIAEAEDGISCLNILEKNIPDILTVDLEMPKMDGITMLSQVHRKYKGIKIIVISSVVSKKVIHKALLHGASVILKKPIDIEVLKNAVEGEK